jgi:hypothetical protein
LSAQKSFTALRERVELNKALSVAFAQDFFFSFFGLSCFGFLNFIPAAFAIFVTSSAVPFLL